MSSWVQVATKSKTALYILDRAANINITDYFPRNGLLRTHSLACARKIGDIFRDACKKANVTGVTFKDIRSKGATDAKEQGYSDEQLKAALAHR